jgi:hypothetical protein
MSGNGLPIIDLSALMQSSVDAAFARLENTCISPAK